MKKKSLQTLQLNKKSISNLLGNGLNGGSSDTGISFGCGPVSITCKSCYYCTFNDCESDVCTVTLDRYCDANTPTN